MTDLVTHRTDDELRVAYSYGLAHLLNLRERSALKFKKRFPTYESWSRLAPSERGEAARSALDDESSRMITLNFDAVIDRAFVDVKKHEREGIRLFSIDSCEYPLLLKQIIDPPLVLFVKGSIEAVSGNSNVAVVGTRDATPVGEKVAARVAKWLGEVGWCVVSGLAKGIDSAAHRGIIEMGGRTAAVMAMPLNKIYPAENSQLAREILEHGGCWIGELPLWKKAHRGSFVTRDRLQSGMSVAVIPVQTDIEGGTMHTVRYAEMQSRLILCPRPIENGQFPKQYAGIVHLIESGRAVPFSNNEYAAILGFLSERREVLLKSCGVERSGEVITDRAANDLEVPEQRPMNEPAGESESKVQPVQGELGFLDEPLKGKPKKKTGEKEREIQLRFLEQLYDELSDAKRPDGGKVSNVDDLRLWLEGKLMILRGNELGDSATGVKEKKSRANGSYS
jgi:DNA processing protein